MELEKALELFDILKLVYKKEKDIDKYVADPEELFQDDIYRDGFICTQQLEDFVLSELKVPEDDSYNKKGHFCRDYISDMITDYYNNSLSRSEFADLLKKYLIYIEENKL